MAGYFIRNLNKGSFLKGERSPDSALTTEKLFNQPDKNSYPKFYEIVPAVVMYTDHTNSSGRILVKKLVGEDSGENEIEAFPLSVYIKKLPLKGEIVLLIEYPVEGSGRISERLDGIYGEVTNSNFYYIDILNLESTPTFSKNLVPLSGDIIYQGRNGQSIRFTSSIRENSNFFGNSFNTELFGSSIVGSSVKNKLKKQDSWVYGTLGDKPLIIISNGKSLSDKLVGNMPNDSIEDINLDDSSIYLTSDNIIPLKINKSIISQFLIQDKKLKYNYAGYTFSGKQIVSVSDNLVFKSRRDTWFFSDGITSVNSVNSIVLTSGKNIVLETTDTGKIYLGRPSPSTKYHSMVKSDELIKILSSLITTLTEDFTHKDNIKAVNILKKCSSDLNKIKSEFTYTI